MLGIVFNSVFVLALGCLTILALEAIGKKRSDKDAATHPHVRLFAIIILFIVLCFILVKAVWEGFFGVQVGDIFSQLACVFLVINSLLAVYLSQYSKAIRNNPILFFLVLAMLSFSLLNVASENLYVKMIASIGYSFLTGTLLMRSVDGGKQVEIGLKMLYNSTFIAILFSATIFVFLASFNSIELNKIIITELKNQYLPMSGIFLYVLAQVALGGFLPFNLAHIDAADSAPNSVAFFLQSNGILQAGINFLALKNIFIRSNDADESLSLLSIVLFTGFFVIWLRALDQNKVRRSLVYTSATIGPVFALSLVFGKSLLLPSLLYYAAVFAYPTLVLFGLYGSLSFMPLLSVHWHTWEDIAGLGRKDQIPSLWLIISLASIAGLPGTIGYFIKLSLISTLKDEWIYSGATLVSIAIGSACLMRLFVFLFSKKAYYESQRLPEDKLPWSMWVVSLILILLGFFPFVR